MKTLTLVRHAKSSWDEPRLADIERPLNERGRRDLPVMARAFANRVGCPDLMISSPATRARDTALAFAEACGYPSGQLRLCADIYEAPLAQLLAVLGRQDKAVDHLLLVGHMPGMGELSQYLCGGPDDKFPTCAIMHMSLSVASWSRLGEGCARELWYSTPKKQQC